ncbi:hypothetical protein RHMOL_Rhmol02G0164500 [Rhododendron molle]|uniref:Uncharacterized protein n=1 Tax=Rhododendron molle TaxID=49168 RepID=A0ACC0PTK8_RHOML|nr:hypothetical protein RHMOL_Rhmol02G0164500 [Rhododendron molle]
MLSYFDLKSILKEFECPDVCEMYQKAPTQTMDDGLVVVTSDKTMVEMFVMHKDNNSNVIDVYVHNPMMEHKKPNGEEESGLTKADHSGQIDDLIDLDDLVVPNDIAELDQGIIPVGPVDEDDESDKKWDRGDVSGDESRDSSDDDSFSGFVDSDEDDLEDNEEVEQGVRVVVINEPAIKIMNEERKLSDKSDDIGCLSNDEEEGGHKRKKKFIEFDEAKDMKNPKLVEGMVFPNVTAFRGLLKEFHIREGCEYTYLKNESSRVIVICKEKCGFRLHASPMHGEKSFQIKRLSADHCCTRNTSTSHNRRTCKTPPENWVNHKGKYYGKQKQMYSGVPPAGKPKNSETGSGSGTVGKGRGIGRGRGTTIGSRTVAVDKGNGRGSVAAAGRGRGKEIGTGANGNVAAAGRGKGRGRGIGSDTSGSVTAVGRGRGRGIGPFASTASEIVGAAERKAVNQPQQKQVY